MRPDLSSAGWQCSFPSIPSTSLVSISPASDTSPRFSWLIEGHIQGSCSSEGANSSRNEIQKSRFSPVFSLLSARNPLARRGHSKKVQTLDSYGKIEKKHFIERFSISVEAWVRCRIPDFHYPSSFPALCCCLEQPSLIAGVGVGALYGYGGYRYVSLTIPFFWASEAPKEPFATHSDPLHAPSSSAILD